MSFRIIMLLAVLASIGVIIALIYVARGVGQ